MIWLYNVSVSWTPDLAICFWQPCQDLRQVFLGMTLYSPTSHQQGSKKTSSYVSDKHQPGGLLAGLESRLNFICYMKFKILVSRIDTFYLSWQDFYTINKIQSIKARSISFSRCSLWSISFYNFYFKCFYHFCQPDQYWCQVQNHRTWYWLSEKNCSKPACNYDFSLIFSPLQKTSKRKVISTLSTLVFCLGPKNILATIQNTQLQTLQVKIKNIIKILTWQGLHIS